MVLDVSTDSDRLLYVAEVLLELHRVVAADDLRGALRNFRFSLGSRDVVEATVHSRAAVGRCRCALVG